MTQIQTTSTFSRPILWAAMLLVGVSWGATTPLGKIAVSTGLHPIGITVWQTLIMAVTLTILVLVTGRRLPLTRNYLLLFLLLGLLGTALPHPLGYFAARHLPASVISIVLAAIPLATLMIATLFGIDHPTPRRLFGLLLGFLAIALIVVPEGSLPDPELLVWIVLPILAVVSYAAENVCIDKIRLPQLNPLVTLCGLSWGAFFLTVPFLVLPRVWIDPFPLDDARLATLVLTGLHLSAYFGLIWLIEKAGAVFATQVSYVVTVSGVLIAIVFLGETASPMIGLATVLMLVGLAFVRPRGG